MLKFLITLLVACVIGINASAKDIGGKLAKEELELQGYSFITPQENAGIFKYSGYNSNQGIWVYYTATREKLKELTFYFSFANFNQNKSSISEQLIADSDLLLLDIKFKKFDKLDKKRANLQKKLLKNLETLSDKHKNTSFTLEKFNCTAEYEGETIYLTIKNRG